MNRDSRLFVCLWSKSTNRTHHVAQLNAFLFVFELQKSLIETFVVCKHWNGEAVIPFMVPMALLLFKVLAFSLEKEREKENNGNSEKFYVVRHV